MQGQYSQKLLKHLQYIGDILHEKMNSKTLGKKFKGEAVFKINIFEGGITNNECEITEKMKNK